MSAQYVAEVASGRPPLEIRRLAYSDLPQVIGVERRAFPTPWSLAMFVLELSKSSGICLAAVLAEAGTDWGDTRFAEAGGRSPLASIPVSASIPKSASAEGACLPASVTEYDRRLVGYLICSRYETVWHVMNVAVAPEHRREGVASALLGELYVRVGDEQARYTLEVRRSNDVAIRLYEREGFRAAGLRRRYYQDNGEDALVMWRTPATLAGSFEDVPNPGFV